MSLKLNPDSGSLTTALQAQRIAMGMMARFMVGQLSLRVTSLNIFHGPECTMRNIG